MSSKSRSTSGSAALALIAATLAIAGCGGSSDNDGSPPPVSPPDNSGPPAGPPAGGAISASNQCQAYPTVTATGITGSVATAVSNPQNRTLNFTLTTPATRGTVNLASNGAFTYTSTDKNRGFSDSFRYSVSDGQGGTAQATYEVVYGKARIMPLGDSITTGVETYDGGEDGGPAAPMRVGYRAKLYELLTTGGYQFDFVGRQKNGEGAGLADPDNESRGGIETTEIVDQILVPALTAGTPDIVLVHLGTNDINENRSATPSATPMQNLLSAARTWSTANQPMQAVVARIINFRTGEAGADKVSVLNDAVTTMINQNFATPGALKVSQADFQSKAIDMTPAPADVTGLHPSRTGYDQMGQIWFDALVAQNLVNKCD